MTRKPLKIAAVVALNIGLWWLAAWCGRDYSDWVKWWAGWPWTLTLFIVGVMSVFYGISEVIHG